jgi:NAD-dependent dihydropyrimidine dehydrogenase PreA subunit
MIREMVKIDEELCNGCGDCIPNCHEGALQIIDDKARLISDLLCDGLGACIGHCPMDAITIEKREAEAYNETKVMEIMVEKGKNTVIAHLKHLKDHNETAYLKEGVHFLRANAEKIKFNVDEIISEVHNHGKPQATHATPSKHHHAKQMMHSGGGCPGSQAISFEPKGMSMDSTKMVSGKSELRQWPVQMHLINPGASYFQGADIVIAADCVAFSMGNFHQEYLKGRSLAIACPKLDSGQDSYVQKMIALIDQSKVNTITVMIMTVPCCGGLLQMVKMAAAQATRKVPIKAAVVSVEGEVVSEEWV